jgi:hypothetical protein
MTAAELKTLRESLGLSMQWSATNIGLVKNVRSWQKWELGERSVPGDVGERIKMLDERAAIAARQALAEAKLKRAEDGSPERVVLMRYATDEALWERFPDMRPLPVAYHAAILARARQMLIDHGFSVEIV